MCVDGTSRLAGSGATESSSSQEGAGNLWDSFINWSSSMSQKYWWNWYFSQFSAQDCNLREVQKVGFYMGRLLWLGCPLEGDLIYQSARGSDISGSQQNEGKISSADESNSSELHSYIDYLLISVLK